MNNQLCFWEQNFAPAPESSFSNFQCSIYSAERYANASSFLKFERDGSMAGNVFRTLSTCHHELDNGWKSHPIKVGEDTIFGIFEVQRELRFENFLDSQFEIVQIDNRMLLTISRDTGNFIIDEFNVHSIMECLERIRDEDKLISKNYYRYCATDPFFCWAFNDVFSPSTCNSIYTKGFKKLNFELTPEFKKIVNKHVVVGDYRLELMWSSDTTLTVQVKYDFIIGGFTLAIIDAETIPKKLTTEINLIDRTSLTSSSPKTIEGKTLTDELTSLTIVDDYRINLPSQQLSHYVKIKSLLTEAGGKYRANGFDFSDRSAREILLKLTVGKVVKAIHKDYGFFATSEEWSNKVVGVLKCLSKQDAKIFEPHAGQGAIADAVRKYGIEPIVNELWSKNAEKLKEKGYSPFTRDFLELNPSDIGGCVDAICGNPPWGNRVDIKHFLHSLTFLKPGGEISMLLSSSAVDNIKVKAVRDFNELLKQQNAVINRVPRNSFENTSVGGVHIYIEHFLHT
ncbi:hypothetical protein DDN60_15530 [Vibrio cholerae]|nr:hypothetical protein [Vibrio cholerae]